MSEANARAEALKKALEGFTENEILQFVAKQKDEAINVEIDRLEKLGVLKAVVDKVAKKFGYVKKNASGEQAEGVKEASGDQSSESSRAGRKSGSTVEIAYADGDKTWRGVGANLPQWVKDNLNAIKSEQGISDIAKEFAKRFGANENRKSGAKIPKAITNYLAS